MSNHPSGISQSNTGHMSGGMQVSIGNSNQQMMSNGVTAADEVPTQPEVIEMLAQLEEVVQGSTIPETDKEKATKYLGAAKAEVEEGEPDKGLVAKNLERATKTLKAANGAVEAGTSLFEKVAPIIKTVAPWLGAAAGALLAML